MTPDRYSRVSLAFDEPGSYPLDVKVFGPDGELIRIIPGATLRDRKLALTRAPEISRRDSIIPSVAMVKPKRREERP